MTTVASFAPGSGTLLPTTTLSANVTIPSGGTIAAVTNLGNALAFIDIGTTSTLVATNTGFPILIGEQEFITIGTATTLAAVSLAGVTQLSVVVGN